MSDRRSIVSIMSAGVRRTKANDMGLVTDIRPLIGSGVVRDWFPGAWQANQEVHGPATLAGYAPVYACVSQISGDIAKLRINLLAQVDGEDEVYEKAVKTSPYWQTLRRPNRYQNRIQFVKHWILCKLLFGNAYALKEFDQRGICVALYLLDPRSTRPIVTPDGEVYYSASREILAGLPTGAQAIPQRFVIHDRGPTLWHPLVGVPPMIAAALSGTLGLKIQQQSATFFGNMSRPSGLITGPKTIDAGEARRLKEGWSENYSGFNVGKLAVLGDALTYQALSMAAETSQLAEQLGISAVDVATAFGMPAYMINQGPMPTNNNVEALQQQYYSRALQQPIEDLELLLTEGLGVPDGYSVEFDLDGLLRMDTSTQMDVLVKGVGGSILKPDEARSKLNRRKVKGGDAVYIQQQNYSLEAIEKRDQLPNPFVIDRPATNPTPSATGPATTADPAAAAAAAADPNAGKALADALRKHLELA